MRSHAQLSVGRDSLRRLHPIRTKQLGLHEHGLDRFFLQVRLVAVLVQDALHDDPDFCPHAFAQGPVDGHAGANLGDEFGGDDLHGAVGGREGVVERDFTIGQTGLSPI